MQTKITYIVSTGFILLWGYAAFLKLWNWQETLKQMELQLFPYSFGHVLAWLLPSIHLILVLILLDKRGQDVGIKVSTILLSVYTGYLLVGLSNIFGHTPCACAGIWPTNHYWLHIVLNSVFIAIGSLYWLLAHKSRAEGDGPIVSCRKEGNISF